MKCGLLGGKLGHSFSLQIHGALADYRYTLCEKTPEELNDFLKNGDFTGLKNVFENALYLSRDKTDGDKMDKEFFWFNMETRQEKLFFTITDADEVSSSSVAVLREGEYVITFDTWNTGDISILYKEKESKSHLLYN